jgi:hypothetical protein
MAKKFYGIDCQGVLLIPRGTNANRPAHAGTNEGSIYWETDTQRLFIDGASDWIRIVLNDGAAYSQLTVPASDSALYA